MRDFFVTWMERLLGVAVVLSILGVGYLAWDAGNSGQPYAWLRAVVVVLAGAVSIVLSFGFAYIALGIHANTRRTAEAVEALLRRSEPRRMPVVTTGAGVAATGQADHEAPPRPRRPSVQGPVGPATSRR